MPRLRSFGIVLVVALAVGCNRGLALPTLPKPPPGILVVCDLAGLTGTLLGSRSDARLAWVLANGLRVDVDWPWGFTARFEPGLQIVAQDGRVVARGGETIRLGGGFSPTSNAFGACQVNGEFFLPSPNPPGAAAGAG